MERIEGTERETDDAVPTVAAHRSSPDRTVFTERGNSDAWISIDADSTIDLGR